MRSLTNEIHVGNYLARQRKNGFLIRGLTPATKGRKFSLKRIATGKWSLSGSVSNGKQERLRKRFDALGLEEAVEEADRFLYGGGPAEPFIKLLICDCFTNWLSTLSIREETKRNYSICIGYFLDWCDSQGLRAWDDLRLQHLEAYASGLVADNKKPRTIKLYTQPARTASRWASQNWPERYKDFAAGFRLPKPNSEYLLADQDPRVFLPLEEVAKFIFWLWDRPRCRNIVVGVALQGLCGLRVREVFRLRWEDIDLVTETVTIQGRVKNAHSVRRLPLPKLVLAVLSELKGRSPYVITGFQDDKNYSEAVRDALNAWRSEPDLETKGLRRTLPSVGVREGWHNYALERFLGHSPKTITDRHYVAYTPDQLLELLRKEIVARVDEVLEPFLQEWQQNGKKKNPKTGPHEDVSSVE